MPKVMVAGLLASAVALMLVLVTTGGDIGWKLALALLGLVL